MTLFTAHHASNRSVCICESILFSIQVKNESLIKVNILLRCHASVQRIFALLIVTVRCFLDPRSVAQRCFTVNAYTPKDVVFGRKSALWSAVLFCLSRSLSKTFLLNWVTIWLNWFVIESRLYNSTIDVKHATPYMYIFFFWLNQVIYFIMGLGIWITSRFSVVKYSTEALKFSSK